MATQLLAHATLATAQGGGYGLVEDGAVVIDNHTVLWVGASKDLPQRFSSLSKRDLSGKLLTPSFIDCHTHVIYGGHRAAEFEQRLNGASYAEIAAAGGGIVSTVTATRDASVAELVDMALPRVDALLAEGVAVIEVKSGYGLDSTTELNMLRAARQLERHRNITIKTSFLGAHAVPSAYKNRADEYIDNVCIPTLKLAHRELLVDAVDGFCESIAFTTEQIARVFDCAQSLGLPVKLHAEQLSLLHGAKLAASYNALSADHLEYLDESGVQAMAKSGTVAVLLPGAFYTLREKQCPPVELLRQYKVPVAIATDANPGSSPLTSLLLTMNMACTLFGLTPEESFAGVTCTAAKALGITNQGLITEGNRADFALWQVNHPAELSYRIGFNPLIERITA